MHILQPAPEGRTDTLQLTYIPQLLQECYRVLASLISWPGRLLSLKPCRRPKFLARMLFLGATDVKQIGTLPKGWQLKSSIKSFVTFRGGGREGGFSLGLFQLSQLSWISNFSTSPTFSSSPNSVSSFTLLISTLPALPIFYFKIGRAWRAQSIRRMKELTELGELEKLGDLEKLEIQES